MIVETERQFMLACKERAELEAEHHRIARQSVVDLGDFLLAEHELKEIESRRDELGAAIRAFDKLHSGDRKGRWMPLHSGTRFWPEDPRPQDIDIRDIARSLSRINRFNGHSRASYSVAQHSVLVSREAHPRLALFALMHDAAEAYLGDVVTPVKNLVRDKFDPLEDAVMRCIAEKYGFLGDYLNDGAREEVKRADVALLATEARDLTTVGFVAQSLSEPPLVERISECWSADKAEQRFLEEFGRLTRGKGTELGLSL